MKKLIAIDGNSLMHRAYYALPSMTAKDGTPTGAIYGFVGMLLKLLSYEPDYLLVPSICTALPSAMSSTASIRRAGGRLRRIFGPSFRC